MKLVKTIIENYRSIERQEFSIEEEKKSHTYTLIGINESGKTSFLRALSLIDTGEVSYPKDFNNPKNPIVVALRYELSLKEKRELNKLLIEKGVLKEVTSRIDIRHVDVAVAFEPVLDSKRQQMDIIEFGEEKLEDYFLEGSLPKKKIDGQEAEGLSLNQLFSNLLPQHFYVESHPVIFWASDSQHLINGEINLDNFATDPEALSVPLFNCFRLAGLKTPEDIRAEIEKIKTDTSARQNLEVRLGDAVTAHIKKTWPNHPIDIVFNINNMQLEFLIDDEKVKYQSKTTSQRSDGFRQFVSFLLTVSADHAAGSLEHSILLLDEPETHLHPRAQEFLKEELIALSRNKFDNVVFFATHSNYMIDRDCISRCFKVEKKGNSRTELTKIKGGATSYAQINYEVFDIISSDYHNELYGIIQDKSAMPLQEDFDNFLSSKKIPKDMTYIKIKKNGTTDTQLVTLPTYIRNQIHHPENKKNPVFTQDDLDKSIKLLLKLA